MIDKLLSEQMLSELPDITWSVRRARATIMIWATKIANIEKALELSLVLLGHGDFKNGNTGPNGIIDEGEVHAGRVMDRIKALVPDIYDNALRKS